MKFKKTGIVLLVFFVIVTFIPDSYAIEDREEVYIHLVRDSEDDLNESFKRGILEKFNAAQGRKFNVTFGSTRNELIKTGDIKTVNWIIYIGHGKSHTGEIADGEGGWISPYDLKGNYNWKIVKGVLIFGCAVVDIGDFGWQNVIGGDPTNNCETAEWYDRGINGNYCLNYYGCSTHSDCSEKFDCSNFEFPDSGLKWEELAKENGIKYILGFNFYAPLIPKGGETLLKKFLTKWIERGLDFDEYFYLSWKDKLNEEMKNINQLERAYIRCDDHSNLPEIECMYSMGRSNNFGDGSEYKDHDIFWPSNWNEAWTEDGWVKYGKYRPFWPGGTNDEMSIDDYRKCIFSDVENDKGPLIPSEAAMHIRELCLRDIVSKDNDKFNPSTHVNRLEWAKMVRRGAGYELIPEQKDYELNFKDYDSKTCPDGKDKDDKLCWAYDYIRDLRAKGVVEGFSDDLLRPTYNTERSHILKFVVKAFFGDHTDKKCADYDNIKNFTDAGDPDWFCHYLAAAINCKLIDPSSKDDQQLFPDISETKIDPKHEVTRAEIAILVNRARRVKETSVDETCYP